MPPLNRSLNAATLSASVMFLYLLAPSFGLAEKSSGQDPQNPAAKQRVIKRVAWRHEPVKLSKLKVKGKEVEPAKKFVEEDDWLNGLTITVKNTSDKTIVWIDLALNFPRPAGSGGEPDARDHLVYGHYPPPPGEAGTPHTQQPPARPGETVELALADYEGTLEFLRKTNYPASIKQVEIDLSEVIFDNGMMWSGDALFRRDPNNPGRWNRVDEPQGPGGDA